MIIKAISLHQPWGSFITMGLKKYETRSWATSYRGQLLICSAKKISRHQKFIHNLLLEKYQQILADTDNYIEWDDLYFGYAIALVDLTACIKMTQPFIKEQSRMELDTGDWSEGRFAWKLENIRRIVRPIPVVGRQGLFNVEVDLNECRVEAIQVMANAFVFDVGAGIA